MGSKNAISRKKRLRGIAIICWCVAVALLVSTVLVGLADALTSGIVTWVLRLVALGAIAAGILLWHRSDPAFGPHQEDEEPQKDRR
jgi:hypothetical protein